MRLSRVRAPRGRMTRPPGFDTAWSGSRRCLLAGLRALLGYAQDDGFSNRPDMRSHGCSGDRLFSDARVVRGALSIGRWGEPSFGARAVLQGFPYRAPLVVSIACEEQCTTDGMYQEYLKGYTECMRMSQSEKIASAHARSRFLRRESHNVKRLVYGSLTFKHALDMNDRQGDAVVRKGKRRQVALRNTSTSGEGDARPERLVAERRGPAPSCRVALHSVRGGPSKGSAAGSYSRPVQQ